MKTVVLRRKLWSAVILAAAIAAALLPTQAIAAEPPPADGGRATSAQEANPLAAQELTPLALVTGTGYTFDPGSGLLTVSTDDGTTNWRFDTNIDQDAAARYSKIKSVLVEEGVHALRSLGIVGQVYHSAFYRCSNLESVSLPTTLTAIGEFAFSDCTSLDSIDIPDSVNSFGIYIFYRCQGLTSARLPSGLTTVPPCIFYDCTNLSSIQIPDSVTRISDAAFEGCASLSSIHIPEGVTRIGDGAFSGCASLTAINLPAGLIEMFGSTFSGSGLTEIAIPQMITELWGSAFGFCQNLTTLYFSSSAAPSLYAGKIPTFEDMPSTGTVYFPAGGTNYTKEYFNQATFNNEFNGWVFDSSAPTLSAGPAQRSSAAAGTVKFTPSRRGAYYYAAVPSGDPVPVIDTSGVGISCATEEQTIPLDTLGSSAAWDVYIRIKDPSTNVSAADFHITIPAYTPPPYLRYAVLEHFGTWEGRGSSSARIDAEHGKFIRLLYNGEAVAPESYDISPGSTIITLSRPYLDSLAAGSRSFIAQYTDGESELIHLTVSRSGTGNSGSTQPGQGSGTGISTPAPGTAAQAQAAAVARRGASAPRTGDDFALLTLALTLPFALAGLCLLTRTLKGSKSKSVAQEKQ